MIDGVDISFFEKKKSTSRQYSKHEKGMTCKFWLPHCSHMNLYWHSHRAQHKHIKYPLFCGQAGLQLEKQKLDEMLGIVGLIAPCSLGILTGMFNIWGPFKLVFGMIALSNIF